MLDVKASSLALPSERVMPGPVRRAAPSMAVPRIPDPLPFNLQTRIVASNWRESTRQVEDEIYLAKLPRFNPWAEKNMPLVGMSPSFSPNANAAGGHSASCSSSFIPALKQPPPLPDPFAVMDTVFPPDRPVAGPSPSLSPPKSKIKATGKVQGLSGLRTPSTRAEVYRMATSQSLRTTKLDPLGAKGTLTSPFQTRRLHGSASASTPDLVTVFDHDAGQSLTTSQAITSNLLATAAGAVDVMTQGRTKGGGCQRATATVASTTSTNAGAAKKDPLRTPGTRESRASQGSLASRGQGGRAVSSMAASLMAEVQAAHLAAGRLWSGASEAPSTYDFPYEDRLEPFDIITINGHEQEVHVLSQLQHRMETAQWERQQQQLQLPPAPGPGRSPSPLPAVGASVGSPAKASLAPVFMRNVLSVEAAHSYASPSSPTAGTGRSSSPLPPPSSVVHPATAGGRVSPSMRDPRELPTQGPMPGYLSIKRHDHTPTELAGAVRRNLMRVESIPVHRGTSTSPTALDRCDVLAVFFFCCPLPVFLLLFLIRSILQI